MSRVRAKSFFVFDPRVHKASHYRAAPNLVDALGGYGGIYSLGQPAKTRRQLIVQLTEDLASGPSKDELLAVINILRRRNRR